MPGARSCPIFPANNPWNERVDRLPVAANSAALIQAIGLDAPVHPDFGSFSGYGIPYTVVGHSTAKVHVSFDYADESDRGPYPLPAHPHIEAGGDRHVLLVDRDSVQAVRAVRRDAHGRDLARGLGRDLEPALEPPATERLDERRRRGPADPARPRALRRGRGGGDLATRSASRPRRPRTRTSGRHATTRETATRACRRWGCACG